MISLDKFTHKMGLFKIHIFVIMAIAYGHHTDGFVVGVRSIPQKDDNLQDTDVLEYLRDVIAKRVSDGQPKMPDTQNLEEKAHNEAQLLKNLQTLRFLEKRSDGDDLSMSALQEYLRDVIIRRDGPGDPPKEPGVLKYFRDVIAKRVGDGSPKMPDRNDIQNPAENAHNEAQLLKNLQTLRFLEKRSDGDDLSMSALQEYLRDVITRRDGPGDPPKEPGVLKYFRDVIAKRVGDGSPKMPDKNDIQNPEEKAHNEKRSDGDDLSMPVLQEYLRDVITRRDGPGDPPAEPGVLEYLRDVIVREVGDGGPAHPRIFMERNDIQNPEENAHNEMKNMEPDRWSEDDDLAALEYYNNDWSQHHKRNPSSDVDASVIQLEKRNRPLGFRANRLEKRQYKHSFLEKQLQKR